MGSQSVDKNNRMSGKTADKIITNENSCTDRGQTTQLLLAFIKNCPGIA